MLTVRNVSVSYGKHRVVKDLSFSLGKDEILMLVGPTGCGKSTILQALAGLVPLSAGDIETEHWTANAQTAVAPEKRRVGMVFQDFALFPHLTVEQNVCFRLKDTAPADHWLSLLGLNELRQRKPSEISGGQKQRVALARTLAHEPSVVLLDEPLSNLDAALKDTLRWDIRNALKAAGLPAIWVTHDQEEALSIGDRVGVLKEGQLQQLDTPEQCFSVPHTRFVASFLGEASFLPGHLQQGRVETSVGSAPAAAIGDASAQVDLLVRPDDFSLAAATDGNGQIGWARYEGGARLYGVDLDGGHQIMVRVSHENALSIGQRVQVEITTTHPLAAYARKASL